MCINNFIEPTLHKFWDLESVDICSKEYASDFVISPVLKSLSETVKFSDSRYAVDLPWKSEAARSSVHDNKRLVRKRILFMGQI